MPSDGLVPCARAAYGCGDPRVPPRPRVSRPPLPMRRPLALALLVVATVVLAGGAFVALRRPWAARDTAPPGMPNPAGFVASDVARLAATGRPQLVELFHYG
jgi:hypothetical protein